MSKAVIEAMKKRMSLEERHRFVTISRYISIEFEDGKSLREVLNKDIFPSCWYSIFDRFTPEELSLTINIKEL